ncbi:MAG: NAD(P)-dependent oxidoreductase [Chitinophagales bacterium]|jgi:nucleoside-diphosphate-sugar epimerase|nr:NAD(P)-dependent oxidoreductase [Chitinophagales bacterium]
MSQVVAITGANGFVGSHLATQLLEEGYEVHCIVRKGSNINALKDLNCTIHPIGLLDTDALVSLFKQYNITWIFHLAGTVKALKLDDYISGNVTPTENILKAASQVSNIQKIVMTSSLAATAPTTVGKPNDENVENKPLTDYGRSKVMQEELAKQYFDTLNITIVRPPVVYGERDTEVLLFFQTVKKGILPLIGKENQSLSLVYVGDLVRGLIDAAVNSQITKSQTYFLGGHQDEYLWKDIADIVSQTFGKSYFTIRVPKFLVHYIAGISEFIAKIMGKVAILNRQKADEMVCPSWSCTSAKANRDFGYTPKMSLQEGLTKTLAWYRNHQWM